jgi:predicted nuclease with TOPRIM domain
MPTGVSGEYTKDSRMYQKQMELTAELHEIQDRNEYLVAMNEALQARLDRLTEAYATLIGDSMNLAEVKEHLPPPPTPIPSGAHELQPPCADPDSRSGMQRSHCSMLVAPSMAEAATAARIRTRDPHRSDQRPYEPTRDESHSPK